MVRASMVLALLLLLVLAAAPAVHAQDNDEGGVSIVLGPLLGTDRDNERFRMRDRDSGREFWAYGDRDTHYYDRDGRRSAFGDLRGDHDIRVEGRWEGDRFHARRVYMMPPADPPRRAPAIQRAPYPTREFQGTVERVYPRTQVLVVLTDQGRYAVQLGRADLRGRRFGEFQPGDRVTIYPEARYRPGEMLGYTGVRATRIRLDSRVRGYRESYPPRGYARPMARTYRDLGIARDINDRTGRFMLDKRPVVVEPGAVVTFRGRPATFRDLHSGDRIEAFGQVYGGVLHADRINIITPNAR